MAEERIDPFNCSDYWRVDHLSRYFFTLPIIRGKSVLDAACGFGYGATLMSNHGAANVAGVDNCPTTIEYAAKHYNSDNVSFMVTDLEKENFLRESFFDIVVSFETLEHLKNPGIGLKNLVSVLKNTGYMIISVPGETDSESDNQYHKQHFTKDSFQSLLQKHFSHVAIYRQFLVIGSTIHANFSANPTHFKVDTKIEEVGHSRDWALDTDPIPDSYVAVCGNGPLPEIENTGTSSRQLWVQLIDELKRWKDFGLNQEAMTEDIQRDLDQKTDDYHRWQAWGGNMEVMVKNLKKYRDNLLLQINELTARNSRQQNEIEELKKKLNQT